MPPLRPRRCLFGLLTFFLLAGGLACGSPAEPRLAQGLWIAYPESLLGAPGPIHLVHGDGDGELRIGVAGSYRSLTWAPDASHIATVAGGPEPELRILPTTGTASERTFPLPSAETALYWSPDGVRIAAVSPGAITLVTPELDIVATFKLPQGLPATGEVGEGLWSVEGDYFAVPFNGYVLIVQPAARWLLADPADFVRDPGESARLTVVDWIEEGVVAIFAEPEDDGPARYVLDVTGDLPILTASSDYPEGTGPLDGLIAEALEASGGREVYVGRRGQPGAARWAVAEPFQPGGSPDLLVRIGEGFEPVLRGRFVGASAQAMATDIGLIRLTAPGEP